MTRLNILLTDEAAQVLEAERERRQDTEPRHITKAEVINDLLLTLDQLRRERGES